MRCRKECREVGGGAEASALADAITRDDPVSRANRAKARQRALAMGRVAGKG